jgi:hypothetical protein
MEVEYGNVGTGGGEPAADGFPNSLTASGDQGNLPIESKKRVAFRHYGYLALMK